MNVPSGRVAPRALLWLLLIPVAHAGLATAAEPNTLSAEELAEGWVLLFDGQTLFGWKPITEADWKVADGVISVSEGEPGLLCTRSQFGNYQLKVDFRSAVGTNSGVFLRTSPKPTDVTTRCYELNIADTADSAFPTGSFVQRQRAIGKHDTADWQTFDVTADGGRFVVRLDGQIVLEYTEPDGARSGSVFGRKISQGTFGLQAHDPKSVVRYKNLRVKRLD